MKSESVNHPVQKELQDKFPQHEKVSNIIRTLWRTFQQAPTNFIMSRQSKLKLQNLEQIMATIGIHMNQPKQGFIKEHSIYRLIYIEILRQCHDLIDFLGREQVYKAYFSAVRKDFVELNKPIKDFELELCGPNLADCFIKPVQSKQDEFYFTLRDGVRGEKLHIQMSCRDVENNSEFHFYQFPVQRISELNLVFRNIKYKNTPNIICFEVSQLQSQSNFQAIFLKLDTQNREHNTHLAPYFIHLYLQQQGVQNLKQLNDPFFLWTNDFKEEYVVIYTESTGNNLEQTIKNRKAQQIPWSEKQIMFLAEELLVTIAGFHAKQFSIRDIRPPKIVYSLNRGQWCFDISQNFTYFGIKEKLYQSEVDLALTKNALITKEMNSKKQAYENINPKLHEKLIQINQNFLVDVVGSPNYMSPQQLAAANFSQPLARINIVSNDYYSLAVVLLRMITLSDEIRINDIQQVLKGAFPNENNRSPLAGLLNLFLSFNEESRLTHSPEQILGFVSGKGQKIKEEKSLILTKEDETKRKNIDVLTVARGLMVIGAQKNGSDFFTIAVKNSENQKDVEQTAQILFQYAYAMQSQNDLVSALSLYKRAQNLFENFYQNRRDSEKQELIPLYNNMGMLLISTQQLEEAYQMLKKSQAIISKVYGPDSIEAARCLQNMGNTFVEDRNYLKALEKFEISFQIKEMYYGFDDIEIGVTSNNIGICLMQLSKFREALTFFKRSLAIKTQYRDFNQNLNDFANIYESIATCLCGIKANDDAFEFFKKALGAKESYFGKQSDQVGALILRMINEAQSLNLQQETGFLVDNLLSNFQPNSRYYQQALQVKNRMWPTYQRELTREEQFYSPQTRKISTASPDHNIKSGKQKQQQAQFLLINGQLSNPMFYNQYKKPIQEEIQKEQPAEKPQRPMSAAVPPKVYQPETNIEKNQESMQQIMQKSALKNHSQSKGLAVNITVPSQALRSTYSKSQIVIHPPDPQIYQKQHQ